jgi:hypothetical protein
VVSMHMEPQKHGELKMGLIEKLGFVKMKTYEECVKKNEELKRNIEELNPEQPCSKTKEMS